MNLPTDVFALRRAEAKLQGFSYGGGWICVFATEDMNIFKTGKCHEKRGS